MMALAFAVACLFQDDTIDQLVRELESERIETRDAAAAKLVKLGEPALAALREAYKAAKGDVAMQLGDVIARIERDVRRRDFKGGNVVEGLCAQVRLADPKKAPKAGEKFELTLEVMNVSDTRRPFAAAQQWDAQVPGNSYSNTSAHGVIVVKQLSGRRPDTMRGCKA